MRSVPLKTVDGVLRHALHEFNVKYDEVDKDADLEDLGIDSLDSVELIILIEDQIDHHLLDDPYLEIRNLGVLRQQLLKDGFVKEQ